MATGAVLVAIMLTCDARAQDTGVQVFATCSGAVAWVQSTSPDSMHLRLRAASVRTPLIEGARRCDR